jgi:hypothetical protein
VNGMVDAEFGWDVQADACVCKRSEESLLGTHALWIRCWQGSISIDAAQLSSQTPLEHNSGSRIDALVLTH